MASRRPAADGRLGQMPAVAFRRLGKRDDMADRKPISTAPTDGSKVTVTWKDSDGVLNESIAQYRDGGWWVYIDSSTQKKVEPTSWRPAASDDGDQ
jgi:hypothetical protein